MNVYAWFRMLSLDVVSSLFIRQAVGALDSATEHEYLSNLDNNLEVSVVRWQMLWLLPLTSWIPLPSWRPTSGNFFGPRTSSAITSTKSRCVGCMMSPIISY